jgi:uncharacterized protein YndB with AHSA1/START domain
MSAAKDANAPSLTYVRRIRATPAAVWNAFVDPRELVHWWGPDAGPTLSAETDLRVGGRFKIAFRTLDGGHYENQGEYLELDPPRRLVMSWWFTAEPSVRSRVTVLIEPSVDGVDLTIRHDGFSDDGLPITHESGWAGAIEKMATRLESMDGRSRPA